MEQACPWKWTNRPEWACASWNSGLVWWAQRWTFSRARTAGRSYAVGCRSEPITHYRYHKERRMIRKLRSGEYRLYSRKRNPKTGRRRNLGTFKSLEAAKKHERAVQYFK